MNTRLIITILCAGALAFACGPRPRSSEPAALASIIPTHPFTAVAPKRHAADKPVAEAKIDSRFAVVVAPKEVRLALDVINIGGKHVELDFPNGRAYDFVVLDSVGRTGWHWADGRIFTQGMPNKQLGAGDALHVNESWTPAGVKPGTYTAVAILNSSNYPVKRQVQFVVK